MYRNFRKTVCVSILSSLLLVSTTNSFAASVDKLNLAGTYKCTGFDSHDGAYTATAILKLDPKASDFAHNFGAYTITLKEGGGADASAYTGEVAAHGDLLAIYFQNTDDKTTDGLTDRGVGIATVSHDQDSKGSFTTSFHKFYYEPNYMRDQKGNTGSVGGRGTEMCVKIK